MASIRPLQSKFLSIDDLRRMKMPDTFINDYINIGKNFEILGSQFQALKLGNQSTTGAFAPVIGWSQDINQSGFVFDVATGEITIAETGVYVVDASVFCDSNTEVEAKIQMYNGSTWSDVNGSLSGNPTSININGILIPLSVSYKLRLVVRDIGGAMNIATNCARLTIGRRA